MATRMILDEVFVGCTRNAEHGHGDHEVGVTVKWLRFLDCVYSAYQPEHEKGDAAVQASRAAWVLQGNGVTVIDLPEATFGCWGADRVALMRDFLWGDA